MRLWRGRHIIKGFVMKKVLKSVTIILFTVLFVYMFTGCLEIITMTAKGVVGVGKITVETVGALGNAAVSAASPITVYDPQEIGEGVYTVKISAEFYQSEEKRKNAIRSFVISKEYESYDFELTRNPAYKRVYWEYTITMPGSIPVDDLP